MDRERTSCPDRLRNPVASSKKLWVVLWIALGACTGPEIENGGGRALNNEQFYYLTQMVKANGWEAGRAEFLRRFGHFVTASAVDSLRVDVERATALPQLPLDWREHPPGSRHGMTRKRIGDHTIDGWLHGLKAIPRPVGSDVIPPTIAALSFLQAGITTTVLVTIAASDAGGVTGYFLSEAGSTPSLAAEGWTSSKPEIFTCAGYGPRVIYAWARDAAGNISARASAIVDVADYQQPAVTAFTMPSESDSLTVPITAFTATDNVGVTGYLVKRTPAPPNLSDPGWSATPPTSFTFESENPSLSLYAFVRDAAGNISAYAEAFVSIEITEEPPPDDEAPFVVSFVLPVAHDALAVPITELVATDNVAVTGFFVKVGSAVAPGLAEPGWSATPPASVTFPAEGDLLAAYAFVRDAAGHVSAPVEARTTIALPDSIAPEVTAFSTPSSASAGSAVTTTITADDDKGVTGYKTTGSAVPPLASDEGWSSAGTFAETYAANGTFTRYPWAKDAAGNVSAVYGSPITVTVEPSEDTTAPVVTAFTVPDTSSTKVVPITSFTATDDVGVTHYMVTASASPPLASSPLWSDSPPTERILSVGTKTLYPWVKDAAGNVCAVYGSPQTVVVTDTTKPWITGFSLGLPTGLEVPVVYLSGLDDGNFQPAAYLITESAAPPLASNPGWGAAPSSYTFGSAGTKTLYPWAKDAAGNVSAVYGAPITVTVA
jgi:hypothetical protein